MPTTIVRAGITLGSVTPSGATSFTQFYDSLIRTKSDPLPKRARPKGIERLFNGTGVYASEIRSKAGLGTLANFGPPPLRPWISTTFSIIEGEADAGSTGSVPTSESSAVWTNQLRSRLKDSSINIAQAFAERKQVEKMLVDGCQRLVRAYSALKKGRPQDVYSALTGGRQLPKGWKRGFKPDVQKTMGDNWLAWQYGVRPLVRDLAGALVEYHKVRSVSPLIRSVTVSSPKRSARATSTTGVSPDVRVVDTLARLTGSVRCYAEFESGSSAWDQTANRLGLFDPVLLLWEVIPYSFVIDWFLQVGDYLQSYGAITGLKRVGIHVSWNFSKTSIISFRGGQSLWTKKQQTREFYSALPGAVLKYGSGISSISRYFSALALIRAPLVNWRSKR